MNTITTHVLDTSRGRPAAGVGVTVEVEASGGWELIGKGSTDVDGRAKDLFSPGFKVRPGTYRIRFDTGAYFSAQEITGFYPEVIVVFTINDPSQHYHVPLLLNPFGYSTYRGS